MLFPFLRLLLLQLPLSRFALFALLFVLLLQKSLLLFALLALEFLLLFQCLPIGLLWYPFLRLLLFQRLARLGLRLGVFVLREKDVWREQGCCYPRQKDTSWNPHRSFLYYVKTNRDAIAFPQPFPQPPAAACGPSFRQAAGQG